MEDGGADEASGPGEDEVHFMRGLGRLGEKGTSC